MNNLARCPYCGEEPTIRTFDPHIGKSKGKIEVYCWKCKRPEWAEAVIDEAGKEAAISKAIDNWNENIARYTAKSKSERETLARCPSCGSRAMIQRKETYYEDADYNSIPVNKARVVCQACPMQTRWDTEAIVVETWNRRINRTAPEKG